MTHRSHQTLGTCLSLIILAGCHGNRTDLVRDERVNLETGNSEHVRFGPVHLWQNHEGIVAYGHVHRCSQCKRRLCGCVLVQILDPDGTTVCETKARCVPTHMCRHCESRCRFRAPLPPSIPNTTAL